MTDKGFNSVPEIVGKSSPYCSTHMELVKMMKESKCYRAGEAARDNEWAQRAQPSAVGCCTKLAMGVSRAKTPV